MGIVDHPGLGPPLKGSLYLRAGTGLDAYSLGILADIGLALAKEALPAIIGGDFNAGPSALRGTGFPNQAGCVLVGPKLATCITKKSSSIVDYFLVTNKLAAAVEAI
eukprot:12299765-Heterocapsa_arctica.AAC.1